MSRDVSVRAGDYALSDTSPTPQRASSGHRRQKSLGGKLAEHLVGYSAPDKKRTRHPPPGYTVAYSKNGHPYLVRVTSGSAADEEAANEHKRVHFPMSVSRELMGEKFGVGIYLYFDFLLYCIITNAILLLLGAINFFVHVHDGIVKEPGSNPIEDLWFYTSYKKSSHLVWLITTSMGVLLWFIFGPYYSLRSQSYFDKQEHITDMDELDGMEDEIKGALDLIKENEHYSNKSRLARIMFSYIVFVLILFLSSIIAFFLVAVSNKETIPVSPAIVSVIVAIFITIANKIWSKICYGLTIFERHRTWSAFRSQNTLKYFLFKMLNVLIMYASRVLVRKYKPLGDGYTGTASCGYTAVGQQIFFILLLDLTLANLWEVVSSQMIATCNKHKGMMGTGSNDSVRPEFDVSDEYLELLYRQFVIYLGFPLFPLVPFLGVLCNVVEYKVDKYRLLRLCQHPKGLRGSMRKFLTFFMFATALVAFASPPFGAFWILYKDKGVEMCCLGQADSSPAGCGIAPK